MLALPEPYRSTILMRWFDDVPPARIAELRGEPVETVRTRLKRGHALLREWLSGLQALVVLAEPSRSAGVVAGGFVMTTLGKVAIGAVAVAAVSATTWTLWSPESTRGATSVANAEAPLPAPESRVQDPAVAPVAAAAVTPEVAPAPSPAAANASSRWDDVTAANWKKLVKEDDGETMKKAIAGLEDETLDLETFFRFLDQSFADSVVVPGTEDVTKSGGKDSVVWVQVYTNEKHERSAVKVEWTKFEVEEHVSLVFDAGSWAHERAVQLDLPSDQLQPQLIVNVIRYSVGNGFIGGFVKLNLGSAGASLADSQALTDKIQLLKKQKRLPSWARFGFRDGQGQHGWTRSDSELPITVSEMERITALYDRFSKEARAIAEASSK